MKRSTIAKDFEAKQASAAGAADRTISAEPTMAANFAASGSSVDWPGAGAVGGGQFASKDEVGELRQAVAMKVRQACRNRCFSGLVGVHVRVHVRMLFRPSMPAVHVLGGAFRSAWQLRDEMQEARN